MSSEFPTTTSQNPSPNPTTSSATPTNTDNNGGGFQFFSPGASPPLILAFLSIALFAGAMVAFIYRKIRMRRLGADFDDPFGLMALAVAGDEGDGRHRDFGEKPKLWDYWAEDRDRNGVDDWENVTPISAIVAGSSSTNSSEVSKSMSSPPLPLYRRFRRGHRHETEVGNTGKEKESDSQLPEEPKLLQVAVAIALPSPRPYASLRDDDEELLAYSIGLCTIPWQAEKG